MNPAFWSFDTAHLDSCQCIIKFLCNRSHLIHTTWETDFFTMVNDFTNRRNNSSCSAKTTLSEVFYFIEFNFSLLCLYPKYSFATYIKERLVMDGRILSDFGVTTLLSLVTKMKFAPPVSSTFVRVAASKYIFSS